MDPNPFNLTDYQLNRVSGYLRNVEKRAKPKFHGGKCPHCHKVYQTAGGLAQHIKWKHNGGDKLGR